MKRILMTLGLVAATASPALADTSALAASLGVSDAAYTTDELIRLRVAQEDGDEATAAAILAGYTRQGVTGDAAALALSLGVEPGLLSTADLIRLRQAMEEGDAGMIAFILGGGTETISTQSAPNAGDRQLAAYLGVDAADYTTAELAEMYLDATD